MATTTTAAERLAALLMGHGLDAKEDARAEAIALYLFGPGPDLPEPLGDALGTCALSALHQLTTSPDLAATVQSIIMASISIGYECREMELQRALVTEDL
ncbi:MAG: hypothetical protein IT318_20125 [Anaerolineales bacterium]|nr:hypothetical protein [Anaerolineales bacterium]